MAMRYITIRGIIVCWRIRAIEIERSLFKSTSDHFFEISYFMLLNFRTFVLFSILFNYSICFLLLLLYFHFLICFIVSFFLLCFCFYFILCRYLLFNKLNKVFFFFYLLLFAFVSLITWYYWVFFFKKKFQLVLTFFVNVST